MNFSPMALRISLTIGVLTQLTQLANASDDNEARTYKFNFEQNHPVVYSLETTVKNLTDQTMQLDTGNKSSLTKSTVETRYKMKLTPVRKAKDGTWTIHYEPLDVEQDLDSTGKAGHIVTNVRGLEIKSTQNGIIVVDTAKSIGEAQAKNIKQLVYPMMLSGYFDLKPDGEISKLEGDLPFIDYWTEVSRYRIGFFDLEFPTSSVAPGGNWNETISLKDLQGLKLGDEGVVETNVFSRGLDTSPGPEHAETFDVSLASNSKDVMGSMEMMGQNTMLNIPSMTASKSGRFQFDRASGNILSCDENESVKITMDMLLQGHSISTTMELETSSKLELLKN